MDKIYNINNYKYYFKIVNDFVYFCYDYVNENFNFYID